MNDKDLHLVQFCPCGCTYYLFRKEIIEAGAKQQLQDIENGKKFDAVILPTSMCEQCNQERLP